MLTLCSAIRHSRAAWSVKACSRVAKSPAPKKICVKAASLASVHVKPAVLNWSKKQTIKPIRPRAFSTSITVVQRDDHGSQGLDSALIGLVQRLSLPIEYRTTAAIPRWTDVKEPSPEALSAILGVSSDMEGLPTRPPALKLPSEEAVKYETVRTAIREGKLAMDSALHILPTAVQLEEYTYMWKILDYVAKHNHWESLSPPLYRRLIDALLPPGASKLRVDEAFRFLQHHLRHHPGYNQPHMNQLAQHFAVALAASQPSRAIRLWNEIKAEQLKQKAGLEHQAALSPEDAFSDALVELQLVSFLPYTQMLLAHVDKALALGSHLTNEASLLLSKQVVTFALINGLISGSHLDSAARMLFTTDLFDLAGEDTQKQWLLLYRNLVQALVKFGEVPFFERLLSALASLPSHLSASIKHYERFEWLLQVHAHASSTYRMGSENAADTLRYMSVVSGVTSSAASAYIAISALNDPKSAPTSLMGKVFDTYAATPNAQSFNTLIETSSGPSHVAELFAKACELGAVDSTTYALLFTRVFSSGPTSSLSEFRLQGLIEQFEKSPFPWTTATATAALGALSHHRQWEQCWKLFEKHFSLGDVQLDTICANVAIEAALKSGAGGKERRALLRSLFADMESNSRRFSEEATKHVPTFREVLRGTKNTPAVGEESRTQAKHTIPSTQASEASVASSSKGSSSSSHDKLSQRGASASANPQQTPTTSQQIPAKSNLAGSQPSALTPSATSSHSDVTAHDLHDRYITSLTRPHPQMILNAHTFSLICISDGYQAGLFQRLTSSPFNIIPTPQTFTSLTRQCAISGNVAAAVQLLCAFVDAHPKSVSDDLISTVIMGLVKSKNTNLIQAVRISLQRHDIQLPDQEQLIRSFQKV